MLTTYGLAILIGALVKLTDRENLKYLAISYFVCVLLLSLVFFGTKNLGAVIVVAGIKSIFVYGWTILLYKAEDTIFTYLIVLVSGVFLLGLF